MSRFLTFNATAGRAQYFRKWRAADGRVRAQANKAYYVVGVIAAKYAEAGGPLGTSGLPVSDEFQVGASRRQEFEGATFDYTPGENLVRVTQKSRRPTVVSTPSRWPATRSVCRRRGLEPGLQLRISVTGQPDFTVTTTSGSYAWDAFVPPTARTGSVTVACRADGRYGPARRRRRIRSGRLRIFDSLTKLRGVLGFAG